MNCLSVLKTFTENTVELYFIELLIYMVKNAHFGWSLGVCGGFHFGVFYSSYKKSPVKTESHCVPSVQKFILYFKTVIFKYNFSSNIL